MLEARAKACQIQLELHGLAGEALDLPSASVDFVFCTLVLCSVDDPARVLAEVRRVLRPGGRFVCIEHVAAPIDSVDRRLQQLLARPWHWLFDNCHLCRDTATLLRAAGFARIELQPMRLPTAILPIRNQIVAVCVN
jgi:ubiquinone/menaquinone biosynthesis C-methylase UbiE